MFVRPDDYSELIKGSEAYNPKTVHYINRFHLIFEGIALLTALLDSLVIFGVEPCILVKASIYAATGYSFLNYILGYIFFFSTRLRLFCLVRHLRNHWINALYLNKKDAKRTNFDVAATLNDATSNPRRLLRLKSGKSDSMKSLVSR